jgi:hypothetical protein
VPESAGGDQVEPAGLVESGAANAGEGHARALRGKMGDKARVCQMGGGQQCGGGFRARQRGGRAGLRGSGAFLRRGDGFEQGVEPGQRLVMAGVPALFGNPAQKIDQLAELHAQTRRARRAGAQDRFQPVVENHRRSRRRRAGAGQTGTGQTGTGGGVKVGRHCCRAGVSCCTVCRHEASPAARQAGSRP